MDNEYKEKMKCFKNYCISYVKEKQKEYGLNKNCIVRSRITKNGLFIYGGKYKSIYGKYDLYTFINKDDINNTWFVNEMLETFIHDSVRLEG